MNGQTKENLITEILTDLEDRHPEGLDAAKRAEIAAGLWEYLDAMESYLIKKERKL